MDSARHHIEDEWRALADEPATPPVPILSSCPPPARVVVSRRRSFTPPPPPPADDVPVTALLPRARGWRLLTPEPQALPLMPDDQLNRWRASERRLWQIAGSLMALALAVVGALALLTFGPSTNAPPIAPAAVAAAPAPLHANDAAGKSNATTASASAKSAAPASAKISAHRHAKIKHARARKLARQ